jgi:hypothetical protein
MTRNLLITLLLYSSTFSFAQGPLAKDWDYRYGGGLDELLWGLQLTDDSGFILTGSTRSDIGGNITQANWGMSYDMWVVKLDSNGLLQWQKRFGGTEQDRCQSLTQTNNKKYLLAGWTQSDVSGDVSQPKWTTAFDTDYWTVLTDSAGNKLWDKRFGGTQNDFLTCSAALTGGNFLLGGNSLSGISGDKSENSRGVNDFWIVKINSGGSKVWDKTFGGSLQDDMAGIAPTSDGGCLLAGWSASGVGGDKTQPGYGDKDFWIVRIDSNGNKLWDKDYGGTGEDRMTSVTALSNGEFLLAGFIASPQGNDITEASHGGYDLWILKIDSAGNKIWDKRIGGTSDDDELGNVIATQDGGYMVAGTSYSDTGADKSENNLGMEQGWAVKLDLGGQREWDNTLFTTGHDETSYVVQTSDGCFVFSVWSQGDIGGYKSQPNWCPGCYSSDFWIIKFCDSTQSTNPIAAVAQVSDICAGTCASFMNLSVNATAYQWYFPGATVDTSTDVNPSSICYNQPGTYDVQLIASNAAGSDTLLLLNFISVFPYPLPQAISQSGDTLYANQGSFSYQWFFNGNLIFGATNDFYVAPSSGNYSVVCTDSNGCEVEAAIHNVVAGIYMQQVLPVLLYPEPVAGEFKISGLSTYKNIDIRIYDMLGIQIHGFKFSTTGSEVRVELPPMATGIYMIEISDDAKLLRGKFVKQ